ncbi:MAG: plasma-membrane proton-efflux P-type ATPase [Candidatus Bathyarchaeia archaeon]|nr:plasma-membrane proton-efflux P-type ATPase [Candidatus Bathyarchaeota archaeon]
MSEYKGLTSAEVVERLRIYGPNKVPEKRESIIAAFLKKFTGLTPYVIEVTAIISFVLGKYIDFIIIVLLLLVNAIIGVFHEYRAGKAVEMLKSKLKISVKALRDGRWDDVAAEYVVPDDIIKLSMGDIVPADGIVLEGFIIIDESTLTGESIPVEKSVNDNVYAGTTVVRGEAIVRIVATGAKTRFGKTVELIQTAKPRLLIEEITNSVTKWLLLIDSLFIVLVVARLILTGLNILDLLPFTLTLLLASIPIALPAMSTVTLALGSVELAKSGIIVRRLEAIEAASMMDVICLDKTGTITENMIIVDKVIPLNGGYSEEDVVLYAALASEEVTKDPVDNAIRQKAREMDIDINIASILEFKPFTPETKRSEALVQIQGEKIRVIKGAPQALLQITNNREDVEEIIRELSKEGLRPLAVAVENQQNTVKIIGLLGLYDKPREDSKQFIDTIKSLGVTPKMVTGDNIYIAKAIASKVGIGERAISLREISKEQMAESIEDIEIFAEVVPEDKYNIVETLQKKGHVVGMTGDGVNDAPALKKADLGIAVSGATDVAKSVASAVLTSPGLREIASIIRLGRMTYRKIVVWTINKIVKTFSIVYFVAISTLLLGLPILTPIHMILMLFLYDFVTLSISIDVLKPSRRPEKWDVRKLAVASTILGIVKLAELFTALHIAKIINLPYPQLQSFMFYILLLSGILNIVNFREAGPFWGSKPGKYMLLAIAVDGMIATMLVWRGIIIPPIPPYTIILALVYTVTVTLLVTDIAKIAIYKLFGHI